MNRSFVRRPNGNRNWSRDQIGILLALVIGVTGQMIVLLIPNPLRVMAPQMPLLAPQDWPGSRIGTRLFFTDDWRPSPSAPYTPFSWEEKRGFQQSLYLPQDLGNASIDQTIVWYANPNENGAMWDQLDPESYNGWPIVERNIDPDKPASFLACNPDSAGLAPQCWYLSNWGHWFTAVFFWRQSDQDLLIQDIHRLAARVDQLLISAPAEPCFLFLCTNSNSAPWEPGAS